jgi:hypothetical protein
VGGGVIDLTLPEALRSLFSTCINSLVSAISIDVLSKAANEGWRTARNDAPAFIISDVFPNMILLP